MGVFGSLGEGENNVGRKVGYGDIGEGDNGFGLNGVEGDEKSSFSIFKVKCVESRANRIGLRFPFWSI